MTEKSWVSTLRPEEYFFVEGCHIIEHHNDPRDEAVSVVQARVEAGIRTRWHRLVDTIERYVITSGTGLVELGDGVVQNVRGGDVVFIPANCPQRITNTGSIDLIFHAVCTPRFRSENYIDCEGSVNE